MSIANEMEDALRELERDTIGPDSQAQWLVFGTLTMPCVPTSISESILIDPNGNPVNVDLAVFIRLDHFDLPAIEAVSAENADALFASTQRIPKSGDIVRFRWTEYRVLTSKLDPTLTYIRLDLADQHSNR